MLMFDTECDMELTLHTHFAVLFYQAQMFPGFKAVHTYLKLQTLPNLRTRYVPNVRSLAGFVRKLLQGTLWRETYV